MADLSTAQSQAIAASIAVIGRAQSPAGRDYWTEQINDNGLQSAIGDMLGSPEATSAPRMADTDGDGKDETVNNPINTGDGDIATDIGQNLIGGTSASLTDLYPDFQTEVSNGNVAKAIANVIEQAANLQDLLGVIGSAGNAGTVLSAIDNRTDAGATFASEFESNSQASWDADDSGLSSSVLSGVTDDKATVPDASTVAQNIAADEGAPDDGKDGKDGGDSTAPSVSDQTVSFKENQSADAEIGTIKATDDTGVDSVTIKAPNSNIDDYVDVAADGSVTITKMGANDESFNDFEKTPNSFDATVEVSDAAGNSSTATVTFKVTDDPADNTDGGGIPDLPSLPGKGGPSPVDSGTSSSENINGNQSGTISGSGGSDRFIFADQQTTVTIDDFENGDQVFFKGAGSLQDVSVSNSTFGDGELTLTAGQVSATLTNIGKADSNIFNASTFETEFGTRGIGLPGEAGGDPADTGDSTAPTINDQTLSVSASASDGASIGTVKASDDTGVDSLTITKGNTDGDGDGTAAFKLDNSGNLTVADAKDVSATSGSSSEFSLTVEAADAAGNSSTGTVTVDVTTGGSGGGDGLPSLPGSGGPGPVSSGTSSSENINGNQSGTISGAGGEDRFIFSQQNTQVTIDDFESGDQLFFDGGVTEGDVSVNNGGFGDGELSLSAGQVSVTLTNLDTNKEGSVFNTSSFTSEFGADALGFA